MFRTIVMAVAIGGAFGAPGRASAASCYTDRVAYELMNPQCEYLPPPVAEDGEGAPSPEAEAEEEVRGTERKTASNSPETRKADEHG